jgi:hypothetical protein
MVGLPSDYKERRSSSGRGAGALRAAGAEGRFAMLRKLVCGLFALTLFAISASAESYSGKIKSVDVGKSTITVTINDKDQEFKVPATAKIVRGKKDVAGGLTAKQFNKAVGNDVTVVTEKKDGTETVTEVRLQKKKKNK